MFALIFNYWSKVLERAWKATRHDFRLETNARIFAAVVVWLGLLIFTYQANPQSFNTALETQNTLKWLLILSIVFPLWLFARMLIAPAAIDKEQIEKISSLENTKSSAENRSKSLVRVGDIKIKFRDIYYEDAKSDDDVIALENKYTDLMQEAYDVISSGVSHAAANAFAPIPTIYSGNIRGSFNESHNTLRLYIDARCNQLDQIISKYDTTQL